MSKFFVNMGCNPEPSAGCESININSLDGSIIVEKLSPCDFDLSVVPSASTGDYTDADARLAVGANAPLTYNSTTGVFGITKADTLTNGYLSSLDWNYFEDKLDSVSSLGLGVSILSGIVSKVAQLKSLKAGSGISITGTSSEITISVVGGMIETDTLATVVSRGNTTGSPISIQGLTLSGVPDAGLGTDNILVRASDGVVKMVPASVFFPPAPTSLDLPIRVVIANDLVLADDFTLLVDTSFGDIDIVYNPVAYPTKIVVVKKITSDANVLRVIPLTGTIDGFVNYETDISGKPVMIQSDGTNLFIIGG